MKIPSPLFRALDLLPFVFSALYLRVTAHEKATNTDGGSTRVRWDATGSITVKQEPFLVGTARRPSVF
jgi:hypothetical protein